MTTAVSRITPCPPGFSDHIYKEAHGVEVPLRVWKAPGGTGGKRPWLFWMHGGGFIAGKHVVPNAWVVPAFQLMNYHVVSVAYRFLPEVQMPGIFDDITDALAWCRSNLPSILGADDIDIDAYVAAGDSAGGTLSSLCGALLRPRPRVVIDVFGVTDMTDPFFYAKLSPERLALPYLQDLEPRDREEQKRSLASRDESKAEFICPWDWELEPNMSEDDLRIFWGTPDFKVEPKHRYRMDLNKYLNREGERLPLLLMQRERYDDEEAFFADVRKRWSAFHMADETYPPTFILHGDADNAVPVEQSYRFEKRLKELSVPVQAVYCPGGEHCFENKIERPDDEGWDEYIAPCMAFVEKHIGGRS